MEDGAFSATASVQPARTVRLGVISALALTTGVLSTDEIVHADHFHLSCMTGMALANSCAVLNATPFEAAIEKLLLTFK